MEKGLKLVIAIIIGLVVLYGIWLLASPLFINNQVDEALPGSANSGNLEVESEPEIPSDDETDNSENSVEPEEDNSGDLEILYQGEFMDADAVHKVSGTAKIITDGEVTYLRFEDFQSTNGPDLKVYVSEDLEANSYVSLGKLKGNIGNQNYEITEDIDFEKYDKVLIWCEAFSVLFGSAEVA